MANIIINGVTLNPNKPNDYKIIHTGWLLAAYSPKNIAKGEEMLKELSSDEKELAYTYKDSCS